MSHPASSFPADRTAPRARTPRGPWPWLLAAGPAVVVLASLASAWVAMRSDDGLVAEDYYKRGLLINRKLAQEATREPHIAVRLDVDAGGRVRARLDGAPDPEPQSLHLHLAHPGDAAHAHTATLQRVEPGIYVGALPIGSSGRWLVTIESDAWRLPTTTVSGPLRELRLRSVDPS